MNMVGLFFTKHCWQMSKDGNKRNTFIVRKDLPATFKSYEEILEKNYED